MKSSITRVIAGALLGGRYAAPPRGDDAAARAAWEQDLLHVREESAKERNAREGVRADDRTHTEIQGWLRDLGRALGFDVWVAVNDRGRPLDGGHQLSRRGRDGCEEPERAVHV